MTFVKSANLRSLLLKSDCPSAIKNCTEFFQKLVDTDVRNTLLTATSAFFVNLATESSTDLNVSGIGLLSASTYKTFCSYLGQSSSLKNAKTLNHFTHNGHTYSVSSRHKGNSSVIIYDRSLKSQVPAHIEDIIQLSSNDVYFAICKYKRRAISDPFKLHPVLRTTLWQTGLGGLMFVHSNDVIGHFASVLFNWNDNEYLAIISLCQVLLNLLIFKLKLICNFLQT